MKKNNKNNDYWCPPLKRILYKSIGILLIILVSLTYYFNPKFWIDKDHILASIIYSCWWMITRAGKGKKND